VRFGPNLFTYIRLFRTFNSDGVLQRISKLAEKGKKSPYPSAHAILAHMAGDLIMPDMHMLALLAHAARRDRDFAMSKKVLHMAHALCYASPRYKILARDRLGALSQPMQPSLEQDLQESKALNNSNKKFGKQSDNKEFKSKTQVRVLKEVPMSAQSLFNTQLAAVERETLHEASTTIPDPNKCTLSMTAPAMPSEAEMTNLYNMAIDTAMLSGRHVDCVYHLLAMMRVGLKPDTQSLFYVFKSLQAENQHAEVLRVYDLMTKWGMQQEQKHVVCKVESLTALGRLIEAYHTLQYVQTLDAAPQTRRMKGGELKEVPSRDFVRPYIFTRLLDYLLWAMRTGSDNTSGSTHPFFSKHNMSKQDLLDAAVGTVVLGLQKESQCKTKYIGADYAAHMLGRMSEASAEEVLQALSYRAPELSANFIDSVRKEKVRRVSKAVQESAAGSDVEEERDRLKYEQEEREARQAWEKDHKGEVM
jgi:hypothetical protein